MTHSHRAGRQETARKRKRQRQLLKIGATVVGLAVVVTAAVIFTTGGDESSPSSTAQQPSTSAAATWSTEPFSGGPRLAVDRVVHDEGLVAYGHEVNATFQLKNVGDQPLTLGEMSVNTLEGC